MRHMTMFTGALLVLVLVGTAHAQEKKAEPRAPFNPFEKAEVGDWLALKATPKTPLLEVKKIEGDEVTVATPEGTQTYSRKKAPTLRELAGVPAETPITDVTVKDDKRVVGGKSFTCKLVTFKIGGTEPATVELWLSKDAKVTGVVALRLKREGSDVTCEAMGFGPKGKTTWGEKPEKEPAPKPNAKLAEMKMTCKLRDITFEQMIGFVQNSADGINIMCAQDVDMEKKVSLDAQDKPLGEVLDILLRQVGCAYEVKDDNVIFIHKKK